MVQPLEFSLDESAAKTEAALVAAGLYPVVSAGRPASPAEITDTVTISQEALASAPSNLLAFSGAQDANSSREAAGNAAFSGESRIQMLLDEGYSLSQIALEFNVALPGVENDFGVKTFSTAA